MDTPVSSTSNPVQEGFAPQQVWVKCPLRPFVFGTLAAIGLLAFYLGTITIAQDWSHALGQLAEDLWFVGAITLGFGLQVGLFTYLRGLHARAGALGTVGMAARLWRTLSSPNCQMPARRLQAALA